MLEIKGIDVYYAAIQALFDVSIKVNKGEIVALIGANGAGKSTLLKTVSGLLKPKKGDIFFENQQLNQKSTVDIVKMGISHVPEGRRVFVEMSVLENLELGAYLKKDKQNIKKSIADVFDKFPRLYERRNQLAGTLSGGEQQMLAIGRALMSSPKLLLLDEPSMGLAPILVQEIFKIIYDINKQGTTILLIEQNAHMALQIADRAYVIETGKIVLSGNAKDIANNPEVKKAYLGG